jgi:hypothetical protein
LRVASKATIAGDVGPKCDVRIRGIWANLITPGVQNDPTHKTKILTILVKCGLAGSSKRHIVDESIDPVGSMYDIPEEVVAA